MPRDRRSKAVFYYLESVRADIEKTLDHADSRAKWRGMVRGVLAYWLEQLFDEGAGNLKDLQTSIEVLKAHLTSLKQENKRLRVELEAIKSRYAQLRRRTE